MTTVTRSPLVDDILKGQHDAMLDEISRAITSRKKVMFRKGTRVRLIGTGDPSVEGMEGKVKNIGQKRITVEFPNGRGMYVPTSMLEIL